MKHIQITKIMSDVVVTATLDMTFIKLKEMMETYLIHHIPVLDDKNKLCGIVSQNDLLRRYISSLRECPDLKTMPNIIAKDIMVTNVVSIRDTDDIKQAAEIMLNQEFHSVPVINAQHHVVGIVTDADLIEHLIKL